jgi:methylmalonyl-CoA mutase (EC 5.4.99.2)
MDVDERIKEQVQQWEEKVYKAWVSKRPERKQRFLTYSGIEVKSPVHSARRQR